MKQVIFTDKAPAAIGPYSQAIKAGNTVYLSGQIGIDPNTQSLVTGGVSVEAAQMFDNIEQLVIAAGGSLASVVKLTLYLTNMVDFAVVNELMQARWTPPYPARACVAVKQLPKGASVEADLIMVSGEA